MRVVVDASALLAFLNDESGSERARAALHRGALISAVNWAEVLARSAELGADPALVAAAISQASGPGLLQVVPFDEAQALHTAKLRLRTKSAGLSLGDRACLALAREAGLPAYTSDRRWRPIAKALGVNLVLIR